MMGEELERTGGVEMASEPLDFASWRIEAVRRFGGSPSLWRFKCPCCGHAQSMQEFEDLKVDPNLAYSDCIGRYDGKHSQVPMGTKPGPCNYTSGGLFCLSPVTVKHPETGEPIRVFEFAD
jgi:hypothetical protein